MDERRFANKSKKKSNIISSNIFLLILIQKYILIKMSILNIESEIA